MSTKRGCFLRAQYDCCIMYGWITVLTETWITGQCIRNSWLISQLEVMIIGSIWKILTKVLYKSLFQQQSCPMTPILQRRSGYVLSYTCSSRSIPQLSMQYVVTQFSENLIYSLRVRCMLFLGGFFIPGSNMEVCSPLKASIRDYELIKENKL